MDFSNESRNLQIGSYLQTLRLEQNLTLEQLSKLSYVPIVHLTSIEEGRFSRFDDFYLKMYLKRYTQSLDVDLEQLYIYATQNPLPELPATETNEQQANERQLTQTQATISAIPKKIENGKPQRKKTTVKTANISSLEAKKKIGRFVVGLTFFIILIVIIIVFVNILQDLGERDSYPDPSDTPPLVENPHEINPTPNDGDEEVEPEPEPEPEPKKETRIEFNQQEGDLFQDFTIVTSRNEMEVRIEHYNNWVGMHFDHTQLVNRIFHEPLEESFSLEGANELLLTIHVGSMGRIDGIFINDVEVPFIAENVRAEQILRFYIKLE